MNDLQERILKIIDEDEDGFFAPEFDGLISREEYSRKEVLRACFDLVDKGVLKKRDCCAVAFERV